MHEPATRFSGHRFVLILMVRNEGKIIRRCLEAVSDFVDMYCVHDTGSSDDTCEQVLEFLKDHPGCLTTSEWRDFGHNRTISFESAQIWLQREEWDLKDTYGLLLDADMVFCPGTLKQQPLGEIGYTIIQKNGTLEYPNCRLVRMDHDWTCKGVTHEYWDGPTQPLPLSVCHIDDKNDGGCKADKFERDARLLEAGLKAEPDNVRYMFYLAQTYHSLGRWKDAIAMYKKRIEAGGWEEEVWYSHYMIGQSWLTLGRTDKFEYWMQRAFERRPWRAEPLYKLTRHFREKGQNDKAWVYCAKGQGMKAPDDSLFVEKDVYSGLFDYEASILAYYLKTPDGLRISTEHLLRDSPTHADNVYRNMPFYIKPLGIQGTPLSLFRDEFGLDYWPSSVSVCGDLLNIRYVNYDTLCDGGYAFKEGGRWTGVGPITQNLCRHRERGADMKMDDSTISLSTHPSANVRGLEDVRLYRDSKGGQWFTATQMQWSAGEEGVRPPLRVLRGRYHADTGEYSQCIVMKSPTDASCEKNWLPVNDSEDMIYRWHPLEIGTPLKDELVIHTTYKTPWFFQHLRGSAVPVRIGDELWVLVHFVEYSSPRKYFHCLVVLNGVTYAPKRMSLPFVFRKVGIEYCLGMEVSGNDLVFYPSTHDNTPYSLRVPRSQFQWAML